MKLVFVTGMSGAGKSSVLNMLEDVGFFCVDNLPISLIPTFISLTGKSSEKIERTALSVDIRSGKSLGEMKNVLQELDAMEYPYTVLFLDASTPVLVKRYKETRRTHPLSEMGRIDKGIEKERFELSFLRERADYILDTSRMLIRELKADIDRIFVEGESFHNFVVTIVSFGYKHGIPADCDLVFDVRFLPNPFYIDELKFKTGNDKEVFDYVMAFEPAKTFLDKLQDMLLFLIPGYMNEGKNQLVVGKGCTGGKRRSVTLARSIHDQLGKLKYAVRLEHRDIEK